LDSEQSKSHLVAGKKKKRHAHKEEWKASEALQIAGFEFGQKKDIWVEE
jgi:hypothetical protein